MVGVVIVKRLNLRYKESIIGYRVTVGDSSKEYDISKKELDDLSRDWGISVIDGASYTVDLYSSNGKLYASDGSDAETITYLDVVDMLKGYDDIDIMGID